MRQAFTVVPLSAGALGEIIADHFLHSIHTGRETGHLGQFNVGHSRSQGHAKKTTGRRRRRRLDRDEDIREKMQPFIDQLFELYEETDPSKGHVSEPHKLQRAQRAIDIWWHIYGRLLLWAQSQIVGYEIARGSPK